jgi:hypothetical protein
MFGAEREPEGLLDLCDLGLAKARVELDAGGSKALDGVLHDVGHVDHPASARLPDSA